MAGGLAGALSPELAACGQLSGPVRCMQALACGGGGERLGQADALLAAGAGAGRASRSADGRVAAVVDGPAWGLGDLGRDLERAGARPRSSGPAALVAEAFRTWGPVAVERVRGPVAWCVHDAASGELFGARDRLGERRLFLRPLPAGLAFSSHLASLELVPHGDLEVDLTGVLDFLSLGHVPAPRSLLRGVVALPAGHAFSYRDGRLSLSRYFDLARPFREGHEAGRIEVSHVVDALDDRIRGAVAQTSGGRAAALLSGGLNSTVVAALLAECRTGPTATFTLGVDGALPDETRRALEIARAIGTDHRMERLSPAEVFGDGDPCLKTGEPFSDPAALVAVRARELAAPHGATLLGGDGADELFGGNPTAPAARRLARWARRDGSAPDEASELRALVAPHVTQPAAAARELLLDEASAAVAHHEPEHAVDELGRRVGGLDPVNRLSFVELASWLPDRVLPLVERSSIAAGVGAASPFVALPVVEKAARLPGNLKLRAATTKLVLRWNHGHHLPPAVLRRRSVGWPTAAAAWLRGVERERFQQLTSDARLERLGLDGRRVRRAHLRLGERDEAGARRLWAVHALTRWEAARERVRALRGAT